jgi:aryl-alcohol dehydrogenase-like predicted oxidoreductase
MTTTQLRTAQLGETSLEMTGLGFGAWAIGGGGWKFGWGPQDDEESIDATRRVLDLGINWSALADLKQEGVVRHIGVSNFDVEQLRRIGQIAPVEMLQPQYSLIERDVAREILPFCERERIGVISTPTRWTRSRPPRAPSSPTRT